MKFTLRITIFIALSTLIIASSSIIIFISVSMGRNSVDNVLDNLVKNVSSSVTNNIINYMMPALMVAKTEDIMYELSFKQNRNLNSADYAVKSRKIAVHFDKKDLEKYGLSKESIIKIVTDIMISKRSFVNWSEMMCNLYSQIPKIHVTDCRTNNFAMVKRMDDGSFSTTYRITFTPRGKNGRQLLITVWDHKNPEYYKDDYRHPKTGRKIDYSNKIELLGASYDPRQRPWYKLANDEFNRAKAEKRHNNPTWTPAYVFYSDETPGLTCSYGLGDKTIDYIYCVDIGIIDISTKYLANLQIGKNGKVFIINETGEIIAYNPYTKKVDDQSTQQEIVKEEIARLITQIPRYDDKTGSGKITGYDFKLTSITESPNELYRTAFEKSGIKLATSDNSTAGAGVPEFRRTKFDFKGTKYMCTFTKFPQESAFKWIVGIVIPENDFMEITKKNTLIIILVSFATLGLSFLIGLFFSNTITRGLNALADETEKIKTFNLDNPERIDSHLVEIHQMGESFYNMELGLRSFSKYVPSEIVRYLIQSGKEAELGGENRVLSVSFSDIADFTTISESLTPHRLVTDLGDYLSEMSNIVLRNDGTIDKYIGDAIMSFWNAPVDCPDHAYQACKSAIESHNRLEELRNTRWIEKQMPLFRARFGINTGELVVGNMGSDRRMNYTVLGDTVNLASRLEGINKMYNTNIICSEFTYELVKDRIACRMLDVVRVKGKTKPVAIFEVAGFRNELAKEHEKFIERYAIGLDCYMNMKFADAIKIFGELCSERPDDRASAVLKDRCERLIINPPGPGWDSVYDRREK